LSIPNLDGFLYNSTLTQIIPEVKNRSNMPFRNSKWDKEKKLPPGSNSWKRSFWIKTFWGHGSSGDGCRS